MILLFIYTCFFFAPRCKYRLPDIYKPLHQPGSVLSAIRATISCTPSNHNLIVQIIAGKGAFRLMLLPAACVRIPVSYTFPGFRFVRINASDLLRTLHMRYIHDQIHIQAFLPDELISYSGHPSSDIILHQDSVRSMQHSQLLQDLFCVLPLPYQPLSRFLRYIWYRKMPHGEFGQKYHRLDCCPTEQPNCHLMNHFY